MDTRFAHLTDWELVQQARHAAAKAEPDIRALLLALAERLEMRLRDYPPVKGHR